MVEIETTFAAATFVEDVEDGSSAMMPQFVEDPAAWQALVAAVERDTGDRVVRYRQGDLLISPMRANLLTAIAPA